MAAIDRITPTKKTKTVVESIQVPSMVVRVAAPKLNMPAPQINVNVSEFTAALDTLNQHIVKLTTALAQTAARAEQRMDEMLKENRRLAEKISKMKPTVNMPARPTSFYVELEKDGSDTVGMRIEAESEDSGKVSSED